MTHLPRVISDYKNDRRTQLAWDANGNLALLWECEKDFTRFHDWDDENRLRMVVGNNRAGYYGYDANGKLIHQAVASGYEYSPPLLSERIVKVNNKAHKVLNL